jgi:hypothetical protein
MKHALFTLALLLTACGPATVQELRMEVAGTTPRGGLQRLRTLCDDGPTMACSAVRAELCAQDAQTVRQGAAAALERRRYSAVQAAPAERPSDCGPDRGLTGLVGVARALDACALQADDGCALAVVTGVDLEVLPELTSWHARQHGWLCGALLSAAPQTPQAAHLLASLRWCTPPQRADLRRRTLLGLAHGLPTPQQATEACAQVRKALPADAEVSDTCAHLSDALGKTLLVSARAAAAAQTPGAALVLATRAQQLGVSVPAVERDAWAARLNRQSLLPVRWLAEGVNGEAQDVLAQAERWLAQKLPRGFVWAPAEPGPGAPPTLIARITAPIRTLERRQHQKGAHRYIARYRDVENPDWRVALGRCKRSRRAFKDCKRKRAGEQADLNACEQRKRDNETTYKACQVAARAAQAAGGTVVWCQRTTEFCGAVGSCSAWETNQLCEAADRTPRTVSEPVHAVHRYRIETVTRTAGLRLEVEAKPGLGAPHGLNRALAFSTSDAHHGGAPGIGLEPDPLNLASRAVVLQQLAAQSAAVAQLTLERVRADHCDRLLAARRAAQASSALRAVVDLDQRRTVAGCSVPAAALRTAQQALLRSL